jgi:uncharacterized protein (PEP-CTERM system associated)
MATTTADSTPGSERSKHLPPFTSTAAIVALLTACHASAAEWRVTPRLDIRQTYTDNVRLAPRGSEQSDFITDLSPGLNVSANGPGLKLKADYAFQYLRYANDGKGNSSFHRLNAATGVDLIKNLFSFDGNASISQQSISLNGVRATDNYAITDNRTTVRTFTASPYLHHEFRGFATAELRYTHTTVDTSANVMSSSQSDGLRLSVNSDSSSRKLGWGINYNTQRNSLANADAVNSSTASGNLRYLVTPQFSLNATGGYDKYDYLATAGTPGPEGRFYSGGFSWQPTERTTLAASAGRRFYGKTYSLSSSVRSRASVWRLSYDENITTSLSQFGLTTTDSTADFLNQLFRSSIPDDAQRQQTVDQFIATTGLPATLTHSINYLTNQFFLQKALRASVAITGAKNTVVFTAFNVSRQPQSVQSAPEALAGLSALTTGDTRQTGLDALWNWRVTALTNAMLNADITKSKTNFNSTEERLKTIRAALAFRLQAKLNGVVELKHAVQTSGASGNNYRENAVSASLMMKF